MTSIEPLEGQPPSSPTSSTSSKKRKRISQSPDATLPHLAPKLSNSEHEAHLLSESSEHSLSRTFLSEEQRLGSASPQSVAVRQFAHLHLNSDTGDLDLPRLPDNILESFIPTRTDESPPAKRLPPPGGIRSPRPRHRSTPFKLPAMSALLSSSPSSISSNASSSTVSSSMETVTAGPALDFDFRSLTWKDSEITGHLMMDPDDDGTGINGLGFKPTTAMATARRQKRRAQIVDWKVRIAKEERERRAERRKYATINEFAQLGDHGEGAKKAVRFAV
jgi:hypothetical protein